MNKRKELYKITLMCSQFSKQNKNQNITTKNEFCIVNTKIEVDYIVDKFNDIGEIALVDMTNTNKNLYFLKDEHDNYENKKFVKNINGGYDWINNRNGMRYNYFIVVEKM